MFCDAATCYLERVAASFILKSRSSEVDSIGFWGVLLHPCVSKIKILRGGGGI